MAAIMPSAHAQVMLCATRDIASGKDAFDRRRVRAVNRNDLPKGPVLDVAAELLGNPAVETVGRAYVKAGSVAGIACPEVGTLTALNRIHTLQ